MEPVRLHKWIADLGLASRREAEQWIKGGKVHVNGHRTTQLGAKIRPGEDQILVQGKRLPDKPAPKVYWMLNKPLGIVTTRSDEKDRPNIYELPQLKRLPFLLSPVGRLDLNTEGLLLLSNDGDLVHKLMHPSFKLPRHYKVFINARLSERSEQRLERGIRLEDGPVAGVQLRYLRRGHQGFWYRVTVFEGRNRIIRRLFQAVGYRVIKLSRVGFGNIALPPQLPAGKARPLTTLEIKALKRATKSNQSQRVPRSKNLRHPRSKSVKAKLH